MSKFRVCFLGTPEFAVESLKSLVGDGHYEVVGVVTQPDRPAGRKMVLTPSPVKVFAQSHGLPVISPEKVSHPDQLEIIKKWGAEVAVVVAFGQILSVPFMQLFKFGAVNVHGSLLPKWRGAAPIQRSVEAGETETGVALQVLVKELDAGDVLGVRKVHVDENKTAMELHDELAVLGADLLHVELMDYLRGNLSPTPQDPTQVTYAKKLDKAESLLDWSQPALTLHNKVRAFTMGPGTYTLRDGKRLKILKTRVHMSSMRNSAKPGTILATDELSFIVQTGDGVLSVLEVQPESKAKMTASEYKSGGALEGVLLGS